MICVIADGQSLSEVLAIGLRQISHFAPLEWPNIFAA
jgi:hypothetical protein